MKGSEKGAEGAPGGEAEGTADAKEAARRKQHRHLCWEVTRLEVAGTIFAEHSRRDQAIH